MTAFFDSSVLIAVLKDTDVHHTWSVAQIGRCKKHRKGPLLSPKSSTASYVTA